MAKNNLPKLKQIQGGLELRSDVNSLQQYLKNLNASQIATTIEIPEQSGKYYNVAEILAYLNNNASTSNTDIDTLKTDVKTLEEIKISDYVRIRGTITTEVVETDGVTTYTYDASFDDAERVAELRAQALVHNTTCTMYTDDNRVIVNEYGVPVTINLQNGVLSSKLYVADIENTMDSEEMQYIPVTENIAFKIFPIGEYTLKTIDKDFILDNEELKAVYYQTAIEDLAFKLANNTEILKAVQELIGTKSVTQAIADATASITSKYQEADTAINNRIDELAKTVSDNETDIEAKVSALDKRVGDNETSIATLNGDADTAGSVANTVKSVVDPLANRTSVVENKVTTLNSDANTPGSVANIIKTAVDPVKTDLTNLTTRVTTAEGSITTLNGDATVVGSVAKSVADAVDPVKSDLVNVTNRVTDAEKNITDNQTNISNNTKAIEQNATEINTLKESLQGSQGDITGLTETVNRLDQKEETWDEQSAYSNNTPIVQGLGSIKVGETFDNVPITEMLNKILYPYVPHVINKFSVSTEGIYEVGDTVDTSNCVVNFTQKSKPITEASIKVVTTKIENSTPVTDSETVVIDVSELSSGSDYTKTIEKEITRDASFTLSMSDGETTLTKSANIKFYRPAYFGIVDPTTDFTDGNTLVNKLTKYVQAPASVNFNFPAFTDMCMVALLPSNWALTSVKDSNDFDVIKAFTKTTVIVTCLDGTDMNYNLYYTNKCSLALNSTYKFNK